jgi:hypothetical protein
MHAPSIVACLGIAPDAHSNVELAVVGTVNTLVARELCETDERVEHTWSEVSVFTTRKQVASAWTEVLDAGHRKALCRIAIYEWVKNRVRLARNSKGTSVAT